MNKIYDSKLKESIDRTFSLIHQLPTPVFIVDPKNDCIIKYNDLAANILGVKPGQFLPVNAYFIFNGDDNIALYFNGEPNTILVWQKRNGQLNVPVLLSSSHYEIEGKPFILWMQNNDIAYAQIKPNPLPPIPLPNGSHMKILLQNMYNDLPIGIIFEDADSLTVLSANDMTKKLLGNTLEGSSLKNIFASVIEPVPHPNKNFHAPYMQISHQDHWYQFYHCSTMWIDDKYVNIVSILDITDSIRSHPTIFEGIDEMTGIFNRKAGVSHLQLQINRIKEDQQSISTVCYFDLNDLKFVNDTFGHSSGDDFITNIVEVLKTVIRQTDIFARMGGDEFLLLFPDCEYQIVENIMETAMKKLDVLNESKEFEFPMTISYGVLEINYQIHLDIDYIMDAVDSKMYYMKQEFKKHRILPVPKKPLDK